jgi:hypothetical protein
MGFDAAKCSRQAFKPDVRYPHMSIPKVALLPLHLQKAQ